MRQERDDGDGGASLGEIVGAVLECESRLRSKLGPMGIDYRGAWEGFKSVRDVGADGEMRVAALKYFHRRVQKIVLHGDDDFYPGLVEILDSRGRVSSDWEKLGLFMIHDVNHLRPSELSNLWIDILTGVYKTNRFGLLNRHFEWGEWISENMEGLLELSILPLEFVRAVAVMEAGEEPERQEVNLRKELTLMGGFLTGGFARDDYQLIVNDQLVMESGEVDEGRNQIVVECADGLEVITNWAMMMASIYNIWKNALKANRRAHYERGDRMLVDVYRGEEKDLEPAKVNVIVREEEGNLVIRIRDEGAGVNVQQMLDQVMDRMRKRVEEMGVEEVRGSQWFRDIQNAVGGDQAELLFNGLSDPGVLERISSETRLNLIFVAGVSGDVARRANSGMGLWGVRYLTQKLGGRVVGRNRSEGGAELMISIPRTSVGIGE